MTVLHYSDWQKWILFLRKHQSCSRVGFSFEKWNYEIWLVLVLFYQYLKTVREKYKIFYTAFRQDVFGSSWVFLFSPSQKLIPAQLHAHFCLVGMGAEPEESQWEISWVEIKPVHKKRKNLCPRAKQNRGFIHHFPCQPQDRRVLSLKTVTWEEKLNIIPFLLLPPDLYAVSCPGCLSPNPRPSLVGWNNE